MPEPRALEARVAVLEAKMDERDRLYATQFKAAETAVDAALAAVHARWSFGFAIVAVLAALFTIFRGSRP